MTVKLDGSIRHISLFYLQKAYKKLTNLLWKCIE